MRACINYTMNLLLLPSCELIEYKLCEIIFVLGFICWWNPISVGTRFQKKIVFHFRDWFFMFWNFKACTTNYIQTIFHLKFFFGRSFFFFFFCWNLISVWSRFHLLDICRVYHSKNLFFMFWDSITQLIY